MDEIREQEAKKEFEGVQVVKCPGCGADMAFDPELGALHCEYCDTVVKLESDQYRQGGKAQRAQARQPAAFRRFARTGT